jgi:hypothetical protein
MGYGGSDVEFVTRGHCGSDGKEQVDDWLCVDGCAVRVLDEMGPRTKSSGGAGSSWGKSAGVHEGWRRKAHENYQAQPPGTYAVDEGGPSRFYPCHDWSLDIAERLAGETPFFYCPKASSSERQFGLAEFLPRARNARKRRHQDLDGSWLERAVCRHPTLKPMKLIIWLATLLRPPVEVKPRICIPFAGAMSEAIAAHLAGWPEIHAIEREGIYCAWGAARYRGMDKWARLTQSDEPGEIRKTAKAAQDAYAELRGKWADWTQDPAGLAQAIEAAEARKLDVAEQAESRHNNERQVTLFEFLD